MASVLQVSIRRTIANASSASLKVPARQIASSKPAFSRSSLVGSRGLTSIPQCRMTVAASGRLTNTTQQQTQYLKIQRRWNSDGSGTLRRWGFEEVNAALPSDSSSSPSHKPAIFIDVREPAELKGTGVIPSAINIPLASQADAIFLTDDEFETRFGFPKPPMEGDSQLVFYCKAGVRAETAAQMAVQAGYDPERVAVYYGSWLDWAKNGGKVEKWEGDDF
ncbi:hypothetical protein N7468_001047 [Penicillium chermesinum]|uniref:Rhodanese domain-containing protein n=1 Tax=Penicillium chermesinum TaxID=63820 RepID=A0A9W9PFU6_9EURO|nr:uncharacterized protein N7468_001047 [Penicillium chermesinum]KAJ5246064.1 hypothetical protein N7468_001047 [Penicillium chermesinum]KAJ6144359.1 hypothetical protein N7470_008254 [Penicillium chermesinum]